MEKKEVITVQELANLKKKSIQGIYKRIKNQNDIIQNFLKRDNNGNVIQPYKIFVRGIDIIYKSDKKETTGNQQNIKSDLVEFKEEKEKRIVYIKTIEILQEQIKLLQERLREEREDKQKKDNLIFELNKRLAESQKTLKQQQKLQ